MGERISQIFDKYQCFYFVEFLFLFLIIAVGDAKNFQPCRINPISHKKIIISITAVLHGWRGSGSIRYITIPLDSRECLVSNMFKALEYFHQLFHKKSHFNALKIYFIILIHHFIIYHLSDILYFNYIY